MVKKVPKLLIYNEKTYKVKDTFVHSSDAIQYAKKNGLDLILSYQSHSVNEQKKWTWYVMEEVGQSGKK